MHKNILIIGNGFDLYHGLPTRYSDFMTFLNNWSIIEGSFENEDFNEPTTSEEYFIIPLGRNGSLTADSMKALALHSNEYDSDAVKFISNVIDSNRWILYFTNVQTGDIGWIDFEMEIENALTIIHDFYTKLLPSSVGRVPIEYMSGRYYTAIDILTSLGNDKFNNKLSREIKYNDVYKDDLLFLEQNTITRLKNDLDDLNKCLQIYLKEFVGRMKIEFYSTQIKAIDNPFVLNFNYTPTYSRVYGQLPALHLHNVHGSIEKDNLVLGIGDDVFDNLDYVYFQKYFQRIQKLTGSQYRKWLDDDSADHSYVVSIFGHSLDKTDKGILKLFFKSKQVKKIVIYYHDRKAYESLVINLINMFGKKYVIRNTGNDRIEFRLMTNHLK